MKGDMNLERRIKVVNKDVDNLIVSSVPGTQTSPLIVEKKSSILYILKII
jgi:hypothetical protein